MKSKNPRLNKDDAAAIDLLLNHSQAVSGKTGARYASAHAASRERVGGVEKLLNLLQWMPAGDPPTDLLKKTLSRVGESADTSHAAIGAAALIAASAQSHA